MTRDEITSLLNQEEKDNWYFNRTRVYLVPQLLSKVKLPLTPKAWFIGDEESPRNIPHLIAVFDFNKRNFSSDIAAIKKNSLYLSDYSFDMSGDNYLHCVVFQIEEEITFQNFLSGNYSRMFTEVEKENYFDTEDKYPNGVKKIMKRAAGTVLKKESRRKEFQQEVNDLKSHGRYKDSRADITIPKSSEYDFKPKWGEETITHLSVVTNPTLLKLFKYNEEEFQTG